RVHGDRRRGEPRAAARIAGAGGASADFRGDLRKGGRRDVAGATRAGAAQGQGPAGSAVGSEGAQGRDGGCVRKWILAGVLCAAACDDAREAAPDELTIVVQADRREIEQQEKSLHEREETLQKDKSQLDARISELARG